MRAPRASHAIVRAAPAAALLMLALFLPACGGTDGAEPATDSGPGSPPVTIEHKYGRTEVPAEPERVVTVGYNEQDFALALGVAPVAVREWFGGRPHATWPWAQDELGDATPTVLPADELNFEQIAALRPDLILGTYSGMTASDYDRLSQIAPTVAQSGEFVDYGMPWQEQTMMIGRALGRERQAERLVAGIEARFARARDQHPELASATALFAYRAENGGFGAYASSDPRGRFLSALGFQAPRNIDELAGDQFFAELSGEQVRLLDHDVLVMIDLASVAASREELLEDPLYRRLDVVREGGDVYPREEVAAALSFSSPLSLPPAIDALVPELAEAVER